MTFQEQVENIQGKINSGVKFEDEDYATVKKLIHAYNQRGNVLEFTFKQVAYFRRLWRTKHIDSGQLGHLLTFIRKTSYIAMKMKRIVT